MYKRQGWGIPITRQKVEYEKTSYFKQDGYPAPRPWYPLPGNLSHEIVPALRAGYVYDLSLIHILPSSPSFAAPPAR